ncbi:leucine-rich repeat domain-containing protein [Acinetobacter baumannii]
MDKKNLAIEEILFNFKKNNLETKLDLSNLDDLQTYDYLKEINKIQKITYLDLSNNIMISDREIDILSNLKNLKTLILSSCLCNSLETFRNFKSLEILDLSDNHITDINNIRLPINLKELDLSENGIDNDINFLEINNLFKLDLSDNLIEKIPHFPLNNNLSTLILYSNFITNTTNLEKLTNLKELNLTKNYISILENIDSCRKIQKIYLGHNRVSTINISDKLDEVKEIYLHNNYINDTSFIEKLPNLELIVLEENNISSLDSLKKLPKIHTLYLSNNNISDITPLISLKKIKKLTLNNNNITDCTTLSHLNNIEYLKLNKNNINNLDFLRKSSKIINIDLSNNKIDNINCLKKILALKKLNRVKINNNPIWEEYGIVLEEKWDSNHIDFFRNFMENYHNYKEVYLPSNILLLGNHSSGKTSLLSKIINIPHNNKSTHALNIIQIESTDQNNYFPLAIIYDFGGQDFYHGLHIPFIKNNSLKLLLIDPKTNNNQISLENKNTVDKIQYTLNFSLEYWIKKIIYQEGIISNRKDILLIQTHLDENPELQWNYTTQVKKQRLLDFFAIDLTKENIDSDYVSKKIIIYLENFKPKVKLSDDRIKATKYILEIHKKNTHFLPNKITTIKNRFFNKSYSLESFKILLEQLHQSGLIFYNPKISNGDYVWLNPKGLIDYLHQNIFTTSFLRNSEKQGVIDSKDIDNLKINKNTLNLLEYYNTIFKHQIKNKIEYIIPNYLPFSDKNDPTVILSSFTLSSANLVLKFLYFIPSNIINHFICFFGMQPDNKIFWRDMIIFTLTTEDKKKYKTIIKVDLESLEIKFFIQSEEKNLNNILSYLFYCSMRFYWHPYATDNKPCNFEMFLKNYKSNENNDYIWKDFYRPKNDSSSINFIPEDLYISIDNLNYVNYNDLIHHNISMPLIKSSTFHKTDNFIKQIFPNKEIAVSPFSIFTEKEFTQVKNVFISYSRRDVEFKDDLSLYLKTTFEGSGHEVWDCGDLDIGKWDDQIQLKLEESDLVIFMLSINFFASKYIIENELIPVLKAAEEGKKKIMCLIVKSFPWDTFAQLGKKAQLKDPNLTNTDQFENQIVNAKSEITNYQFLPYTRTITSSINSDNCEQLTPLNHLSQPEREKIYGDIVKRVAQILGI